MPSEHRENQILSTVLEPDAWPAHWGANRGVAEARSARRTAGAEEVHSECLASWQTRGATRQVAPCKDSPGLAGAGHTAAGPGHAADLQDRGCWCWTHTLLLAPPGAGGHCSGNPPPRQVPDDWSGPQSTSQSRGTHTWPGPSVHAQHLAASWRGTPELGAKMPIQRRCFTRPWVSTASVGEGTLSTPGCPGEGAHRQVTSRCHPRSRAEHPSVRESRKLHGAQILGAGWQSHICTATTATVSLILGGEGEGGCRERRASCGVAGTPERTASAQKYP